MTLAPIRGTPAGASIPGFPIEEPRAKPEQPTTVPTSGDQRRPMRTRQRHMSIEICGSGISLTFKVLPELPAISRASMTVQVVADTVAVGFLRMSAPNARAFLY